MRGSPVPIVAVSDLSDDEVLLDVREDDEWAAGHTPGAVHIPMSELVARQDEIPAGSPVRVMCRVGGRSAQVTAYLLGHAVDAVNVDGGMAAWQAAGKPVVTDDGGPGFVL